MLWSARRTIVGIVVLLAGIVGINVASTDAVPLPDDDFKFLVDQDAKQILNILNVGKPGEGVPLKKTADRSIKSSALMIAAYAQSRIGKNPADDGKLVALRDAAIKVALTGKMYKNAVDPAKTLSIDIAAAAKANGKSIDLIKATNIDMEELMYQFKKTTVGGLGIEEEIKANAKKVTVKPEQAAAIGQRTLIVAEFCDTLEPSGGFSAAKSKKSWEKYNADMKAAANDLIAGAKAKNEKGIQTAFLKLDGSCVACHNTFK